MARCACGNAACSCIIKAVPNGGIVVTGSGSPERPYEISASGGGNPLDGLAVVDSATVDLTLTGAGTIQDKKLLRADVIARLRDLKDVSKTDIPVTGDVVQWNGTEWVFGTPGATAVPVSGVWGTPPLGLYGADSTIGQPIYSDSNGVIRAAPLAMTVGALVATDPITAYPLGGSVLTISNASAVSGGWPQGVSGTLSTFHRYDSGGSNVGYQVWVRNQISAPGTIMLMRVSSGGTWGSWFAIGGQVPHYSARKPASQTLTTANTSYTITYDTVVENEGGIGYSAGIFTVPVAGKYQVNFDQHLQVTGNPTFTTYLNKNGTAVKVQSFGGQSTNRNIQLSKAIKLAAGDTISLQIRSTVANCVAYGTASSGSAYSTVDITLIGG